MDSDDSTKWPLIWWSAIILHQLNIIDAKILLGSLQICWIVEGELRYLVDHLFQECCVTGLTKLPPPLMLIWVCLRLGSRGWPIRKWPGVSEAIPLSSFASESCKREVWSWGKPLSDKEQLWSLQRFSLHSPTICLRWRLHDAGLLECWIFIECFVLSRNFVTESCVTCCWRHNAKFPLFARWK